MTEERHENFQHAEGILSPGFRDDGALVRRSERFGDIGRVELGAYTPNENCRECDTW